LIDETFKRIPAYQPQEVVRVAAPIVPPDVRRAFEAADAQLTLIDEAKIPAPAAEKARYVVKVALYWRAIGEYELALKRLDRASELNPPAPDALQQIGQTLAYLGADTPAGARKTAILKRAEAAILQSERLRGKPTSTTLHDLAWIADERGDFVRAVALYRNAIHLDREEAAEQGRPLNRAITYNLACALAKAGEFEATLKELACILHVDENYEWVKSDPDFETLRNAEPWRMKLAEMIVSAERQAASAAAETRERQT
jgi:tetratricopeptide (TPR) repeat protein